MSSSPPAEKTQVSSQAPVLDDKLNSSGTCILACPFCFHPFPSKGGDPNLFFSQDSASRSTLECKFCDKSFSGRGSHFDMVTGGGGGGGGRAVEISAQFFRLPVIPYIYERGWRQSFSLFWGFPGPDKELELMKEYLKPVSNGGGGIIVDASCGSGLLSRRFAKSELFSKVIALDFSEAMLQQCYDFIKQEKNFPEEKIILVRADIARLPFASNTVDAVHAGAALHCWPSPSSAVQEIRRVLKPGGVFIATTVVLDGAFCCLFRPPQQRDIRLSKYQPFRFFRSDKELQDLCASSGLINFKCFRNRRFVMIVATKPL